MNSRRVFSVMAACCLVLASAATGQEPTADDPLESTVPVEPELTWRDFSVKAYTIQIFGGRFGGSQYLNLPLTASRVGWAEFPLVMSYTTGDWWPHGNQEGQLNYHISDSDPGWDSPIKTIEDGITIGLKLCSYVGDQVHIDLLFAYTSTQASLTMVNREDKDNLYRAEIDRDPSVQIMRAALQLGYDLDGFGLLGFRPYFGLGFGGILNRYSNLSDVGALFLVGTFGLQRRFIGDISLFLQGDLTTFNMARNELHYTKTVTYKDISAGISFYFDTVPADIRALHEAQKAEPRRRR